MAQVLTEASASRECNTSADGGGLDQDEVKAAEGRLLADEDALRRDTERDLQAIAEDRERLELALVEQEARRHRRIHVKVDNRDVELERGVYPVFELKRLLGVAAERELDVIKAGVLTPLQDAATFEICAPEIFVSHVRTGGSS